MKKYIAIFFFIVILFSTSYSQFKFRGGMGVDYVSTPSLYQYFNENFSQPGSQLGSFGASVNFSVEGDYLVSNTYEVGVDVAYRIYSYNNNYNLGTYNLSYHNVMPTFVNYYVINGGGYQFKFGGGIGVRFLKADETLPGSTSTQTYTSTGFGLLLRAVGNTQISSSFYANILLDVRYDINGAPKRNGLNIYNGVDGSNVNFNSFSVGVGLGLTYNL